MPVDRAKPKSPIVGIRRWFFTSIKDVSWFQVEMNDPLFVDGGQPACDTERDVQGFLNRHEPLFAKEVVKVAVGYQLGDEVEEAFLRILKERQHVE